MGGGAGWLQDPLPLPLPPDRPVDADAEADWRGVRERVIAVLEAEDLARGRAPSRYPVFEPALTAGEIAEAEAQCGVALPGGYRSFLAQVGAGGPGPELRLTSLRRVGGRWGWVWDTFSDHLCILDPGGPFTETADWAGQQAAALRAAGYEPGPPDEDDGYLAGYRRAFGGRAGEEAWYRQRERGAVRISSNGCGMTSWLIAVGPHRGELRHRDCGVNPAFRPQADAHGNRHTFHTWYLEWLERRESQAAAPQPDPPSGRCC